MGGEIVWGHFNYQLSRILKLINQVFTSSKPFQCDSNHRWIVYGGSSWIKGDTSHSSTWTEPSRVLLDSSWSGNSLTFSVLFCPFKSTLWHFVLWYELKTFRYSKPPKRINEDYSHLKWQWLQILTLIYKLIACYSKYSEWKHLLNITKLLEVKCLT